MTKYCTPQTALHGWQTCTCGVGEAEELKTGGRSLLFRADLGQESAFQLTGHVVQASRDHAIFHPVLTVP